jgi:hypothetical protein
MPVSVNWGTRVITIPQSYLTFISGTLYELDVEQLRLDLHDLLDDNEGMAYPDIFRHATEFTLSGVTYARFIEIINGYTITFEEVGPPYRVRCVGANHNISDVQNLNNVSLIIGNSGGLVVADGGDPIAIADAVWSRPTSSASATAGSVGEWLVKKVLTVGKFLGLK